MIVPQVQVVDWKHHAYTFEPTKSELGECAVQAVWEPVIETSLSATRHRMYVHGRLSSLIESPWTVPGLQEWS